MSYKGKINVYTCALGHRTVTIDLDEGVTPFMIGCRKCRDLPDLRRDFFDGMAKSAFYRADQMQRATHGWRKATAEEYQKMDRGSKEHADQGGLFLHELPVKKTEAVQALRNVTEVPASKTQVEQFESFLNAVTEMRSWQKAYFKATKWTAASKDALANSKAAEHRVDRLITKLSLKPAANDQGSLF